MRKKERDIINRLCHAEEQHHNDQKCIPETDQHEDQRRTRINVSRYDSQKEVTRRR